ncbi:MAG: 23S rRNA (guanosine(2251)-2'-O)-methyltransferase RlmB [Flavobacteriia bacterium]|nr:23S rRNA (guanosine(2251)-2'-O)-methyltransferase RlmB [Flavobacteriia bacterium]
MKKEETNFSKKRYYEKKEKEFLIYGIHAVKEAILSEKSIQKIIIQKGVNKEIFHEIAQLTKGKDYTIQYAPVEKLDRETKNAHQGIIAFLSPVTFYSFEELLEELSEVDRKKTFLALDRITDVRNFGAICRTAVAMGVEAVLIPQFSSVLITPEAVKTSSGAIHQLKICKVKQLKESLFYAQQTGYRIISCTEKSKHKLNEVNLRGNVVLVLGSEEDGISNDIIHLSDITTKIPMSGKISSLNVSVACGILLYEKYRQNL